MANLFNWETFLHRKALVKFDNNDDKIHFLSECQNRGVRWCGNDRTLPLEFTDCNLVYIGEDGKMYNNGKHLNEVMVYACNPYSVDLL